MLSNYYTLAAVATDLSLRLAGTTISEAYSQEKNELILSFDHMREVLFVSCTPQTNTLYLHPNFSRARTNSADVLKATQGKSILSISIQPMDRVISFRLKDGITLHIQLFGSKANVLLVDEGSRIIDAFKDARSIVGNTYVSSRGDIVHDIAALRATIEQEPAQTVLAVLRHVSPVLGSTLANEILFRCNVQSTSRAEDLTKRQVEQLENSLTAVLIELAHQKPLVYVEKQPPQAPRRFSLVKLEHCREFEERPFTNIHEAIRFFISRTRSTSVLQSSAGGIISKLRQHETKLRRTITAVEDDLKDGSWTDEYDRYARLLMENISSVKKGTKSVVLPDDSTSITVPLDEKLSPIQNAQRYFEKTKKSRLAYGQARERLVALRAALHAVDELVVRAETIQTKEELGAFMIEHSSELEKLGIGEKAREREQLPFRIFTVDGGFEVWAGKSSRNNDELTMKHAKPNDLWFHARGASGSHVILKTNTGSGEPGKKAKEQAAAIAAYYSKMRNVKMVPVAMTERKYVRKPKGSSPGSVVLEREKVIFAEPALPQA